MGATVVVWDREESPLDATDEVLRWQSYAEDSRAASIPAYLEHKGERLREKFLAFIHDLGECRVDGKRIIDHLNTGDGFSYWWMTQLAEKSPFKSPRIYDCLRLMALEEILNDRKPSDLALHTPDLELAQAIGQLCRNLKITFTWCPGEPSTGGWAWRKCYGAMPFLVQGLISLRHIVLRWPLRRLKKPLWFSGENAVFLCSYFIHLDPALCRKGIFYSRQWEVLPKYLHDRGRQANWIQHFLFTPTVPDTKTGLRWLRLFNADTSKQGAHAFLDTYLTWEIIARALHSWLQLNLIAWRLRTIKLYFYPEGSVAWLWPFLKRDWLTSLKGPIAMGNCLWVALFDAALKEIPKQETGLYLCENQGWEMAFLHAWRKHGHGRIVGVPHATVPFWHLYYFDDSRTLNSTQQCTKPLPDCLALNGTMARRAFEAQGYRKEQLIDVEALRYLNLLHMTTTPASAEHSPQSTTEPGSVTVLILGDMIPMSMHRFLRLVEDAAKLLPSGYRFTFKPHPGMVPDLSKYPCLSTDVTTDALDRILFGYDCVVAANSTSASVDAYVAGLSVIIGLDGAGLNLSPLRGQRGVHFVSTPGELAQALRDAKVTMPAHRDRNEFFFLDRDLPRWQRLLKLGRVETDFTSSRGV